MRRAVPALLLILLLPAAAARAYPTAQAGVSMDGWQQRLTEGRTAGLYFHPWLTLQTFDVLARAGRDVPRAQRVEATVGAIEEDVDLAECSPFPPYAELDRSRPVPGNVELAASAFENARAALERRLGFPIEEIAEHLDDWTTYARIGLLFATEGQRVALLRDTLAGYPSHRAENHFLAAPGRRYRGLFDSPEFVLVESNGSLLDWLEAERNTCGLPALREARAQGREAQAWRLLGHILHLLQDAAVPAHVRNDTHAPLPHPANLVGSIFAPLGIDLRGDQSFDWFDPVEDALEIPVDAFRRYEEMVGPARLAGVVAAEPLSADEAIEEMSGFVRGRFYSRDTILRTRVGGVEVGEVALRDPRLHRTGAEAWCLVNAWGERVACATLDALEDAALLDEDAGPPPSELAVPEDTLVRLARRGGLGITRDCIQDYLHAAVPKLLALSAGVVRHEMRR